MTHYAKDDEFNPMYPVVAIILVLATLVGMRSFYTQDAGEVVVPEGSQPIVQTGGGE